MTYEEYLALEQTSAEKHEFVDGLVVAMAGGTLEHARLQARLIGELTRLLGDRPCVVYSADGRVRVQATNRSTYPDLTVVCGDTETASDDANAITNPILIVEVLSESTERDDRGAKFAHYRRLPSLQEYVLVSQDAPRVEVFRRAEQMWTFREAVEGEEIELGSLGVTLSVDSIYRDPRG
jgi:Uma2 family endonuclease